VAGAAIDRFGAKRVVPIGAALVGSASLLFGTATSPPQTSGRFLQGAGGVSPSLVAVYLITKNFPATMVASFVGATQMFGMAGGSAGHFCVGPLIKRGLPWASSGLRGLLGIVLAVCMLLLLPKETRNPATKKPAFLPPCSPRSESLSQSASILCGLIAGLLFYSTTDPCMTWGVLPAGSPGRNRGRRHSRRHRSPPGLDDRLPIARFISDRLGRRKPVIFSPAHLSCWAMVGWPLFGEPTIFRGAGVGSSSASPPARPCFPTQSSGSQPAEFGRFRHRRHQLHQFHLSALLARSSAHAS